MALYKRNCKNANCGVVSTYDSTTKKLNVTLGFGTQICKDCQKFHKSGGTIGADA